LPFETIFPREASETWQETRRVRDEARLLRRGGWFPVLLFGLAALGSSPFYRVSLCGPRSGNCPGRALQQPGVGTTIINPIGGSGRGTSIYWVAASAWRLSRSSWNLRWRSPAWRLPAG